MKWFFSKYLFAGMIVVVSSIAARADVLPAPSRWTNQRGSVLEIWSITDGQVRGQFTNNASGFACQGIPYPVSGRSAGSAVMLVVTFAQCNSITRWRGQVGGNQLRANWNLFYIQPNGDLGNLPGADLFQRTN